MNAESTVQNNKKRFTSYDRSAVTGLDYAVNRTYDSKQGRFTQVDPIGMAAVSATNPQTLNLYAYCANDPINHTDPDGLFFGKLFKAIGKIFSVVNKILKWVAVAVIVAVAVVTIFSLPGAQVLIGIIGSVLGQAGSLIYSFAEAAHIGISTTGAIISGLYGVGAIASRYANGQGGGEDDEVITIETRCPKSGTTNDPKCPGTGRRGIGQPGFWVSLIPVLGSGLSAIDHFQNGEWGWGLLQTALAITDIFLVKSIVTAVGKGVFKAGAKGLTTPSKYFGSKTYGEVEKVLTKEFGSPRGGGRFNKSFYDINSKRTFNLHQDPTHHGGRPHVDIRRRGFPNSRPPYFLKP